MESGIIRGSVVPTYEDEQPLLSTSECIARNRRTAMERMFAKPQGYTDHRVNGAKKAYGGYINAISIFCLKSPESPEAADEQITKQYAKVFDSKRSYNIQELGRYFPKDQDCYFTKNAFKGRTKFRRDFLYNYRNIVINLDANDISVQEANTLARNAAVTLKNEIDGGKFCDFEPNAIVMTGCGIQIVWTIFPLDGRSKTSRMFYLWAVNNLIKTMEYWLDQHPEYQQLKIDRGTARNVVGFVRMPGSYNTRVLHELGEDFARVEILNPNNAKIHSIDTLTSIWFEDEQDQQAEQAKQLETNKENKIPENDTSTSETASKSNEIDPFDLGDNPFSMTPLEYLLYYKNTLQRVRQQNPDGVFKGMRDWTMFVLCNLLIKYKSPNQVLDEILKLNQELCVPPLPESQLRYYMGPSLQKEEEDRYGETAPGYLLSKKYIENTLHFTEPLRPVVDYAKMNRIHALQKAKNMSKNCEIRRQAKKMYEDGMSYSDIGKKMKKTRQTISTWINTLEEYETRTQEAVNALEPFKIENMYHYKECMELMEEYRDLDREYAEQKKREIAEEAEKFKNGVFVENDGNLFHENEFLWPFGEPYEEMCGKFAFVGLPYEDEDGRYIGGWLADFDPELDAFLAQFWSRSPTFNPDLRLPYNKEKGFDRPMQDDLLLTLRRNNVCAQQWVLDHEEFMANSGFVRKSPTPQFKIYLTKTVPGVLPPPEAFARNASRPDCSYPECRRPYSLANEPPKPTGPLVTKTTFATSNN